MAIVVQEDDVVPSANKFSTNPNAVQQRGESGQAIIPRNVVCLDVNFCQPSEPLSRLKRCNDLHLTALLTQVGAKPQ